MQPRDVTPVLVAIPLLALSVLVARAHAGTVCQKRYTDKGTTVVDEETGITWLKYIPSKVEDFHAASIDCNKRGAKLPSIRAMLTVADDGAGTLVPNIGGHIASSKGYWTASSATKGNVYIMGPNGGVSADTTNPNVQGHKHDYRCVK